MKKLTPGLLAAVSAVALLAGPASAAPTVAITSPADGTTVSRSQTPQLNLAGAVAFDTPEPTQTRFYLRRTACTGAADNPQLNTAPGAYAGGCGNTGAITPLNEIGRTTGLVAPATDVYPAANGVPFTLDGSRPITGRLVLSSYQPPAYAGVGTVQVDVTLTGATSSGSSTIGTDSESYTVLPTQAPTQVNFSIAPPASLDKKDFTELTLTVEIRGIHAVHGFIAHGTSSYLDVPQYTASFDRKVQVAVDNGAFSSTGVTVAPSLETFSATINTPTAGFTHAIKVRAVQGGATSSVAQIGVTVVA